MTPSGADRWPARCCPPTDRRCTSAAATNTYGRSTATTASAKWSVPLNYLAQTPPSVTPDGLVIAGGGPGSRLTAVRDTADEGEVLWTRDDTSPLTTSSLAGLGYAVMRDGSEGEPGLALTVFTLGDGNIVNTLSPAERDRMARGGLDRPRRTRGDRHQ